ncbi:MAG: peptidase S41 [Odoribacter sp.]|nr:peptidase S41 [Odoribacter sp.]
MSILKSTITLALLLTVSGVWAQGNALWMRYPAISPDGKTIAFNYKGDIYTVSSEGGRATQLTTHPAYDGQAVWSPDSKSIAFASDREGGMDVYLVDATGGTPKRLTWNSTSEVPITFTPDGKKVLFQAYLLPDAGYTQFPSGSQVYAVDLNGGRPEQFLTFEAYNIQFNKKGDKIIYHDKKGYEDEWRKHHKSSVTRDVWMHDLKTGTFTNLTQQEVEDRNPVFAENEENIYFLSERFGDFNICKMPVNNPKAIKQITKHSKHPVRFLSKANDGTLCYFFNGEIYTLKEGQQPKKLNVNIVGDQLEQEVTPINMGGSAREIALSPNGKEIAFIVRGDVFVTSVEYNTTKRITNTASQERSVSFSPDGRTLVYAAERDGNWNVYTATLADSTDKLFTYAKEIKEEQLTKGENAKFEPQFSPDGKEVAFLENRTEIKVINLKSKKVRTVLPGKYNYSYADGDQWYQWSPDGKWILAKYFEKGGWQNTDVALVKADGSGEIHNLTNSGYSDGAPKWMMEGKAIIWESDRAGYRSHGSWGAHYDVYAMFLDPEAWDEFKMNKEESALAKELKKETPAKEEKKADKKEGKKKEEKKKEEDSKLPKLTIDFNNLEDRIARLTINSSNLGDAVLTKDGSKLYYLASFEGGYDLWVRDFKEGSTRILSKLNKWGGALEMDKEGKNLFLLAGGQISKIDINSGKVTPVTFTAEMELKKPQEREYIFDHAWQQVVDKFYDPAIHNVDWNFYKKEYKRFLPHINNNHDFAEALGELLGELNASHTGARYYGYNRAPQTAALGAFYDPEYKGDGLKIKEVIEKGPLNNAKTKIKAGVIIEKINNQPIKAGEDYFGLLNNQSGKRIYLSLYNPTTKERWSEYVKPISQGTQNGLLYDRWVKQRKELVEKLSDGKIGYVHIKGMNSQSFREIYSEIFGRYRNKEAIILDTRFNGGGWLHEDLVNMLSGKKFAEFLPRGQYIGQDPFAQWTKPSAVIMSEGNYSNAHGFPWVYKELGIGKLVGMPVPGTMTAVWWETQQDPTLVFGIPEVGMKDNQGRYLENLQLEPDIRVTNDPASAIQGRDLQLEATVKSLLEDLRK